MFSSGLKRVLGYTIFWSIIFIGLYFFFWRGSIHELNRKSNKIDQIEKAIAQNKKYVEDWPVTAERELRQAKEDLEKFLAKIPDKEDIPEVLKEIQEYGIENAQLTLISIENVTEKKKPKEDTKEKQKAKKKEGKEKYAKSTYKLATTGNYFNVLEFIRNLETMGRLVNIEEFSVGSSSNVDNIILELTFSIFYSKPEEEQVFADKI